MKNEIVKYETYNKHNASELNDLDGTFDDIGQLIAYLRDLSRQLVPLVDSLVPLSENLNDLIENYSIKLEKFFLNNPILTIGEIIGIAMVDGMLGDVASQQIIGGIASGLGNGVGKLIDLGIDYVRAKGIVKTPVQATEQQYQQAIFQENIN